MIKLQFKRIFFNEEEAAEKTSTLGQLYKTIGNLISVYGKEEEIIIQDETFTNYAYDSIDEFFSFLEPTEAERKGGKNEKSL